MNAFCTTRTFALVACTTVAALSFSAAAHAGYIYYQCSPCNAGSYGPGYRTSYYCYPNNGSNYRPSNCSVYYSYPNCSSYCPNSRASYRPKYRSYSVGYYPPTTYYQPQTSYGYGWAAAFGYEPSATYEEPSATYEEPSYESE